MIDTEVNNIIGDFMGWDKLEYTNSNCTGKPPTESLDALVPVWDKLRTISFGCEDFSENLRSVDLILSKKGFWCCQLVSGECNPISDSYRGMLTVSQAAAHATAEAIQDLNASI